MHTGGGSLADWLGSILTLGRVFRFGSRPSSLPRSSPQARPGTNRERPATEPGRPARASSTRDGCRNRSVAPTLARSIHFMKLKLTSFTRRPSHVLRVFQRPPTVFSATFPAATGNTRQTSGAMAVPQSLISILGAIERSGGLVTIVASTKPAHGRQRPSRILGPCRSGPGRLS